jgi:hypothetical protein
VNQPEVMVPFAQEKIDANGRVTDQKTKEKNKELLEALVVWTRKLRCFACVSCSPDLLGHFPDCSAVLCMANDREG